MRAPYVSGDKIRVDGRLARVMHVIRTDALATSSQWRLLCRWDETGHPIDDPVYCDDDGQGRLVEPADQPQRSTV